MNKLAILALLIICGAVVVANSCTPFTSQSTCSSRANCSFTPTSGGTCVDKCTLLDKTDCGKNTTNCAYTKTTVCALSTCTGTDSNACTRSGAFCEFTAAKGTCGFFNKTILANSCHSKDGQAVECDQTNGCKYNGANSKCNANDDYCNVNSDNTACTNSPDSICKFTIMVPAKCTNKTPLNDCSGQKDNTACGAQNGCSWTAFSCTNIDAKSCSSSLDKANCEASTKYCTYDANGTCTTSSSIYGAYLTVVGSILSTTILI